MGGSHTASGPPPGPLLGVPSCPLTQSTMRIRPTLSFCCRSLAEMATELKKQKPLGGGTWGEHSWHPP